MTDFDLLIKNGTIVDGTRVPRYLGDVAIRAGKIVQVDQRIRGSARRVIDADGLIVAPGFIDLHTHYDSQIQWDPWCTISGWHGVTSVVLGNCGFGFAPVKRQDRDRLMLSMTRNEQIPLETMREGMLWDWETFPEYMRTLERIPKGVNCLTYTPVNPLMIYVMGIDAAKTRGATAGERAELKRLLGESMAAGSFGWSAQRSGENSGQADYDGTPMVSDTMREEECWALAEVLKERSSGFIQITPGTGEAGVDRGVVEKLAKISGRPIIYNVVLPLQERPEVHRENLEWLEYCNNHGMRMIGQGVTVRSPAIMTLYNWGFYDISPAWREALCGTIEEKKIKLTSSELRRRMLEDMERGVVQYGAGGGHPRVFIVYGIEEGHPDDFPGVRPYLGMTVEDAAKKMGKHPVDAFVELALAGGLKTQFLTKGVGVEVEPKYAAEIVNSPYVVPGVSDGGAHTKFWTGGAYATDLLTWLVRDEKLVTLEEAHYKLSYLPAFAAGFRDRGVLREGAAADVVVYDLQGLARHKTGAWWESDVAHDLPANEWRRVQRPQGYDWIIVNGKVTFEHGECSGETPGILIKNG